MKVILNKDFNNLGEEGDTVEVKSGYARNFLIPKQIAVYDSPAARALFKTRAAAIAKRKEEKKAKGLELKKRLETYEVKFVMPVADNGHLFGSITPVMIQNFFLKDEIEIDRKKIEVATKEIKTPGTFSFTVSLYGGETQQVKLVIEAEKRPEKKTAEKKPRRVRDEEKKAEEEQQAEEVPAEQEKAPAVESAADKEEKTE